MISYVMLVSVGICALVGQGTSSLEVLARRARIPARWLWLAAMVVSMLWSLGIRPRVFAQESSLPGALPKPLFEGGPRPFVLVPSRSRDFLTDAFQVLPRQDWPVFAGWALLSAGMIGALSLAVWSHRRFSRAAQTMDRHVPPIAYDSNVGPAAIGIVNPCIVLPDWFDELPESERQIVLAHEVEHLRARDPLLLLVGFSLTALFPWNLALWWQLRRLHLAIELDCDQRLIGMGFSRREYGTALLNLAERISIDGPGLTPTFAAPAYQLRSRIAAVAAPAGSLTSSVMGWRLSWAIAFLVAALSIAAREPNLRDRIQLSIDLPFGRSSWPTEPDPQALSFVRSIPAVRLSPLLERASHDSTLFILRDSAGRFVDLAVGPTRFRGPKGLNAMFPAFPSNRFAFFTDVDSAAAANSLLRDTHAVFVFLRSAERARLDSLLREENRMFVLNTFASHQLRQSASGQTPPYVIIVVARDRRVIDVLVAATASGVDSLLARIPIAKQDGMAGCFLKAADWIPDAQCQIAQVRP